MSEKEQGFFAPFMEGQGGMARTGKIFLLAATVLGGFLSMVACQKEAPPPAAVVSPAQIGISETQMKDLETRLATLLEPVKYEYNPSGKPDPFEPFLRSMAASLPEKAGVPGAKGEQRPKECATPLECMDVGQLTLTGIITRGDGCRMALAQDAAGIGYFLTPGTKVGYRHGKVTEILDDRVIVAEEGEDVRGRRTVQKRVLLLHPEEE